MFATDVKMKHTSCLQLRNVRHFLSNTHSLKICKLSDFTLQHIGAFLDHAQAILKQLQKFALRFQQTAHHGTVYPQVHQFSTPKIPHLARLPKTVYAKSDLK